MNFLKKEARIFIFICLLAGNAFSQEAAPLSIEHLDGRKETTEAFFTGKKGKVLLINFWATWCPYCRKEIPAFEKISQKYADKGVEVIGISLDEQGMRVVKPYVEKNDISYLIVTGDQDVPLAFGGIQGLPTTFLVNRKGELVRSFVGMNGERKYSSEIEEWLGK